MAESTVLRYALNSSVLPVVSAAAVQPPCALDVGDAYGTVSTGTVTSAGSKPPPPVKCDRYKTELCRTFDENGSCRYGDKCQFAHGVTELRTIARHPKYKTDLCRTFHTSGFCPYGSRCHFIHSLHERQPPPPVHAANLFLPVNAAQLASAPQLGSRVMVSDKQPLAVLLQTLSSQLHTRQLHCADPIAAGQPKARDPMLVDLMSTASLSTGSSSPCPSPTSLPAVDDLFSSTSYFATSSPPLFPMADPGAVLTPPGSPGSAASSLNSFGSDFDASFDATWSKSWSSPVKSVNVSVIPDVAHSQLLNYKRSIFA